MIFLNLFLALFLFGQISHGQTGGKWIVTFTNVASDATTTTTTPTTTTTTEMITTA